MTESDFWADEVSKLKSFGLAERIEDILKTGTSDVVYCLRWMSEPPRMGWIELKRLPEWPKRDDTIVRLPHYTTQQVKFLERWGKAGAGAFLLAHVERDFLLFPWASAQAVYDGIVKEHLPNFAIVRGTDKFPTARVLRCLTAR